MRKTIYGIYTAWDYDLELQRINEMSEQGWQLVKGATFYQVYEKSDKKYRYHLEFAPQGWKQSEEVSRFFDIYKEQGWEMVNSTFNGWYYFRKEIVEGTDESDYMVFTDDSSLKEMTNRWIVLARVVQALFVVYSVTLFLQFSTKGFLRDIVMGILYLLFVGFLQAGVVSMKRKSVQPIAKKKASGLSRLLGLFAIALIIGMTLISLNSPILLTSCSVDEKWVVEEGVNKNFETFTIHNDGEYNMYLKLECQDDNSQAIIEIVDENQNVVLRSGGHEYNLTKQLHLQKGEYNVRLSIDAENGVSDEVRTMLRIGK